MKRDLDLVRDILMYVEAAAESEADISRMDEDIAKVAFHG